MIQVFKTNKMLIHFQQKVILLLFSILSPVILFAQKTYTDSLEISIKTSFQYASNSYQPLWNLSRQLGEFSDKKIDQSTTIRLDNNFIIKEDWNFVYGLSLVNQDHYSRTFLQKAFLKLNGKTIIIQAGRYEQTSGVNIPSPSSGTLGISNNAIPIPQIEVKTNGFISVPFTNNWLKFLALISHGWLGEGRYVSNAWLHQKAFYLKTGNEAFNFTAGIHHFGQGGGTHIIEGQLPNRFVDYLTLMVGGRGKRTDKFNNPDWANGLGNHMIIPEFSFNFKNKSIATSLYTQSIFERGTSPVANSRDKLEDLSIFSRDRLAGVQISLLNTRFKPTFVLERIYTKYQGGDIIFVGQDNYYNNSVYRTGWNYKDRILGSPLFINRARAENYFDNRNFDSWGTVSNRFSGWHFGMEIKFSSKLKSETLVTYNRHFGAFNTEQSLFDPPQSQWYIAQTASARFTPRLVTNVSVAIDRGMLSDNLGTRIGIQYFFIKPILNSYKYK